MSYLSFGFIAIGTEPVLCKACDILYADPTQTVVSLNCIKIQFVPRSRHSRHRYRTYQLMLCRQKAICPEIPTEHIYKCTLWGRM